MAIVKKESVRQPAVIDLTGPAGNAFVLMSYARNYAKQLGRDPEPILARMKAGDYENLVKVFDDEFGEFVTLLR